MLIEVMIGKSSDDSACSVVQDARLYSVLDTVVISGEDVCSSGVITLIRDNITFTTTDIPSTINTHNTELQMIHINNINISE